MERIIFMFMILLVPASISGFADNKLLDDAIKNNGLLG